MKSKQIMLLWHYYNYYTVTNISNELIKLVVSTGNKSISHRHNVINPKKSLFSNIFSKLVLRSMLLVTLFSNALVTLFSGLLIIVTNNSRLEEVVA